MPPQAKPVGWGETAPPNQWSAAPGAKPKTTAGWDEASWAMAQRAKVGSITISASLTGLPLLPTQFQATLLTFMSPSPQLS